MFINDISYEGGAVSVVDSEEDWKKKLDKIVDEKKNNNFNKTKNIFISKRDTVQSVNYITGMSKSSSCANVTICVTEKLDTEIRKYIENVF